MSSHNRFPDYGDQLPRESPVGLTGPRQAPCDHGAGVPAPDPQVLCGRRLNANEASGVVQQQQQKGSTTQESTTQREQRQ